MRPPAPFPGPAGMGVARGTPSSPRWLPLLSVLLLPLLGGESRRAGGAREPLGPKGAPWRSAWTTGAEEIPGRGAGARWAGDEVPAAGRWRSPRLLGLAPLAPAPARTRFQPPGSFPGPSREFARELTGVAGSRAPVGRFFAGEKRRPPPHLGVAARWLRVGEMESPRQAQPR